MALPKLNETLSFTMNIPSLGKQVKYRPYLVKEEKVLLQAFESKDTQVCMRAMCDTIAACLDPRENIDVGDLATFDVEFMFTQIRAKSVGETSTILIKCKECEHANPYEIDLDQLAVEVENKANIINVSDEIAVELSYPSYNKLGKVNTEEGNVDTAFDVIASNISAVITPDERVDCSAIPFEEVQDFVSSMTAGQLQKVSDFFNDIPALSHVASFNCSKCGTENELELRGLSDFF
jgi:hypothetical protein